MLENVVEFVRNKRKLSGVSWFSGQGGDTKYEPYKTGEYDYCESDISKEIEETDKRISVLTLYGSLSVLVFVLLFQYGEAFLRPGLASALDLALLGGDVLRAWSWLLVPLLCGFVTSSFTWMMIYKDSRIPGVDPPTPLARGKTARRVTQNEHSFHLNYAFAVLIGCFVFAQMLYARL